MASGQSIPLWNPYLNINTNVTGISIKNTGGEVGGWWLSNNAASARFLKFYDTAATPDNTYTPILVVQIPASGAANIIAPAGINFNNGIAIRATNNVAYNDNSTPANNDVVVNIFWK